MQRFAKCVCAGRAMGQSAVHRDRPPLHRGRGLLKGRHARHGASLGTRHHSSVHRAEHRAVRLHHPDPDGRRRGSRNATTGTESGGGGRYRVRVLDRRCRSGRVPRRPATQLGRATSCAHRRGRVGGALAGAHADPSCRDGGEQGGRSARATGRRSAPHGRAEGRDTAFRTARLLARPCVRA